MQMLIHHILLVLFSFVLRIISCMLFNLLMRASTCFRMDFK